MLYSPWKMFKCTGGFINERRVLQVQVLDVKLTLKAFDESIFRVAETGGWVLRSVYDMYIKGAFSTLFISFRYIWGV